MKDKIDYLKDLPIIKQLKIEEIKKIEDKFHIENIAKGKYVFEEGDSCVWIYFVCKGRVKLLAHSSAGKDFILRIVSSNDLISDNNLLYKRNLECVYSAKALESSVVAKITSIDFNDILEKKSEIYKHYTEIIDIHLMEAYRSLRNMAFEKVERRIARHLIQFAKNTGEKTEQGIKLGVKLSRQEIANLTGTTIETAIRVMSKLKKSKIIMEKEGHIYIVEKHKLVVIAEEF
ncbi:MAG: Crp/Fnr family transcriptional regulator [Candidatus Delongbacteria bacterium]|nr:Crp/Fnr family transcriptional regulator [Candidatus Delongbacteria bacterium]MCG2760568.1 Crp/Fnr family transcriptional regulator [Candidatus Delongbacteria bacterium]